MAAFWRAFDPGRGESYEQCLNDLTHVDNLVKVPILGHIRQPKVDKSKYHYKLIRFMFLY